MGNRIRIETVAVLRDYVLRIRWDDGVQRDVDLAPVLWGPVFEELKNPGFFSRVEIDELADTVVWPNGADIAPEFLRGPHPIYRDDAARAS